jgi:hypothetical protein
MKEVRLIIAAELMAPMIHKVATEEDIRKMAEKALLATDILMRLESPEDYERSEEVHTSSPDERRRVAMAYGVCPKCGALCAYRERRPNGNDTCTRGHTYPSSQAVRVSEPKEG